MSSRNADRHFHFEIELLPLILAGPIVRHTEIDRVTVWIALKEARQVTLKVYGTENGQGSLLDRQVCEGTATTVALGRYLHIVAITAESVDGDRLEPGKIYAYDLEFGDDQEDLITAVNYPNFHSSVTISYFPHQLPTFAIPPENLEHLQIVHGSCRKPHGKGNDALSLLDNIIERTANRSLSRPHQLFLTGDQIYSDDVADPLLWLASQLGDTLLGWQENLPIEHQNNANCQYLEANRLKPGKRAEIARIHAGFTAMLHNQPEKAKSHLFSWGEYCAIYLLFWSPILWVQKFPLGKTIQNDRQLAKQWDREVKAIEQFKSSLWKVRRALANITTYTICDDHDISDDWYLNQEWCDRVLSKPLGRKVVQNGLLAYAVFQAWGNTPDQFSKGQAGEKLLQTTCQWSKSAGSDENASSLIARYLGIPEQDLQTGLPKYQLDRHTLILDQNYPDRTESLKWHYSVRSYKHEIIVLDTRTHRGYPKGESTHFPAMLLSPSAFQEQIHKPLTQTDRLKAIGESDVEMTIFVLPTNIVSLALIDRVQHFDWKQGKVFSNDVGDAWNLNQTALSQLLSSIFEQRDRAIVLSGDIHYGSVVRLDYWSPSSLQLTAKNQNQYTQAIDDRQKTESTGVLVQLTSSPFKNGELMSYLVHTKLKSLFPERSRLWAGWLQPPRLLEIAVSSPINKVKALFGFDRSSKTKVIESLPDFFYQIEWIKREKARVFSRLQQYSFSHNLATKYLQSLEWVIFCWWRNRWFQEGEELVGRNNISIVSFRWSSFDRTVIQKLYWQAPWHQNLIVSSQYSVSLQKKQRLSIVVQSNPESTK